jgi:hypothetical protein
VRSLIGCDSIDRIFKREIELHKNKLRACWDFGFTKSCSMEPGTNQSELLQLFEGAWLSSPSANKCYAKVVKGNLLIAYSCSEENKLAGHYFNSRLIGNKLVCRFEHFDPYAAGVLVLKLGENRTLKGGWWLHEKLPKAIQEDAYQINESIPDMVRCVWLPMPKMPKARIPAWAKEYFLKDSSNE